MTRRSPSRKAGSPKRCENFADAVAGRGLDLMVGIEEGQAEGRGQAAADGGLAGAHQTDQHDAAPGQVVGQVGGWNLQRVVARHHTPG